jgi:hypothetical protein
MSALADFFLRLGDGIIARIRKFNRKRTPRQHLEDVAEWDRPCISLMNGRCAVCDKRVADTLGRCPGPPASQAARRKLKESKG